MYNSNLIMAVKVNGKVLREFDGTVALPFGSEYSIFLKNNSSRRASVNPTIDGQDVLDGTSIIVNANSSMELKRFIKNGNFETGNAFKFIEKTDKIEKFRGNKAEDGLLTVSYTFEKAYQYNPALHYRSFAGSYGSILRSSQSNSTSSELCYTADVPQSNNGPVTIQSAVATASSTTMAFNSAGITAPGSVVEQQFTPVYGFIPDGNLLTMTLKMVGAIEGQAPVVAPVTVKRKVRCTICGTFCKQTAKFCHECSASVLIV